MNIVRPTLMVDREVCIRNIRRMADKAREKHLKFRPHFKTHQSAKIGEWFRELGVSAITVSSVSMASYFARNGWKDITIAFPVNVLEIGEINQLAAAIQLNLLVENQESLIFLDRFLTAEVGIFIEIDTGHHRTGILPEQTDRVDRLLGIIHSNEQLVFQGFLSHTGHTYEATSHNDIYNRHFDALLKLRGLKSRYRAIYPNLILSMGDTPSATLCENFNGIDEIRPGNFIFYDLMQHKLGVCRIEDIAVRLVCPVIARHSSRNEIVIYGGAIHISKDSITNIDGKELYGQVVIRLDGKKQLLDERNYLFRLSQEHGIIKVTPQNFGNFNIGDLVEIIPVHSCLTANLMNHFITTDGEPIATGHARLG